MRLQHKQELKAIEDGWRKTVQAQEERLERLATVETKLTRKMGDSKVQLHHHMCTSASLYSPRGFCHRHWRSQKSSVHRRWQSCSARRPSAVAERLWSDPAQTTDLDAALDHLVQTARGPILEA